MDEIYKCQCNECNHIFDSNKIAEGKYQEYPGASYQPYFVSPCCHSEYDEIDD